MISRNLIIALFLLFGLTTSFSQGSIYTKAEKAFKNQQYNKAKELYQKAYERSNDRSEKTQISFQMANCARLTGQFRVAESYYKRTIKLRYFEMFADPLVFYYLGECYKGQGKYNEAIAYYENYKQKNGADIKMANGAIQGCQMSKDWIAEGSRYRVLNVQKLNSRYNDFCPSFGDKKNKYLFFSSAREEAVGKSKDSYTKQDYVDIFYSFDYTEQKRKIDKKRKKKIDPKDHMPIWLPPTNDLEDDLEILEEKYDDVKFGFGLEEINMKDSDEAAVCFSKGGKRMFFTRSTKVKNQYNPKRIYSVEFKSGQFGEPTIEEIPVDDLIDVQHPAISSDGKVLYFVAEMEGGLGGYDIYSCTYDRRKKAWGEPKNLGEKINTSGDEKFPYISKSGALFFASNGHPGMGGLDIFKSELTVDGFSFPVNMRYPINTPYDDFGVLFEDETEVKGYLSSNRKDKKWKPKGGDDIYLIDLQLINFELMGKILDVDTNEPLSGVKVELVGPNGTHITTTNGKGEYKISREQFKENQDYQIQFSKEWFFTQRDTTISTINIDKTKCKEEADGNLLFTFSRGVFLETSRRPMVLRSVEFDLNKFNLRSEGMQELDSLADLLIHDYPNVVVELRSHTDFRGSQELNVPLSQNRAQSCVDYLVEKGVSAERLVAIGMSDKEPKLLDVSENGLTSGLLNKDYINQLKSNRLKEAAHQMNRRTDFKIISENFEDWLKEKKQDDSPVQQGVLDEDGNLIEIED